MKKKPRVVSKNAKATGAEGVRLRLESPKFFGRIAAVNSAAVRGAKGFVALNPEFAVARVETIFRFGNNTARQSNTLGVKFDVVDGLWYGGSALTVYAALTPLGYNKAGELVKAKGVGYASGATGLFGTAMPQNSQVTVQLDRRGKRWTLLG